MSKSGIVLSEENSSYTYSYKGINLRTKTLMAIGLTIFLLLIIIMGNFMLSAENLSTNFAIKNQPPSADNLFGTDWLGRDMFTRTVKGLNISLAVGMIASAVSALIALCLGICAATMGKRVDAIVTWLIDLFLGVPHLIIIIMITFAMGGGMRGVIVGVAVTHWPSLARVIRAEVMQLRSADYIQVAQRLGKTRWWIATRHLLPHLAPQFFIGLILLFPHAILHEAGISFLGFGLSPETPAIGIILSESMRYLSTGMWWLAFFPGLALLVMVRSFDILGNNLLLLFDPHRARE